MINRLANRVAFVFVSYGESTKENADIYAYALEAIIAVTTSLLICIIVSLFFGFIIEGIVFMLGFVILRRVTGGYHAKSHKICISTFAIVIIIAMFILTLLSEQEISKYISLLMSCIALIGIFSITIINKSTNVMYTFSLKKISKIGVFLITGLWFLCVSSTVILSTQIGFALSLSMFAVFGSLIAHIISTLARKEVKINE